MLQVINGEMYVKKLLTSRPMRSLNSIDQVIEQMCHECPIKFAAETVTRLSDLKSQPIPDN